MGGDEGEGDATLASSGGATRLKGPHLSTIRSMQMMQELQVRPPPPPLGRPLLLLACLPLRQARVGGRPGAGPGGPGGAGARAARLHRHVEAPDSRAAAGGRGAPPRGRAGCGGSAKAGLAGLGLLALPSCFLTKGRKAPG